MDWKTLTSLSRFKDIVMVLLRYGFDDLVDRLNIPGTKFMRKKRSHRPKEPGEWLAGYPGPLLRGSRDMKNQIETEIPLDHPVIKSQGIDGLSLAPPGAKERGLVCG